MFFVLLIFFNWGRIFSTFQWKKVSLYSSQAVWRPEAVRVLLSLRASDIKNLAGITNSNIIPKITYFIYNTSNIK